MAAQLAASQEGLSSVSKLQPSEPQISQEMGTTEYAILTATIHAKMRIERAVPTLHLYATVVQYATVATRNCVFQRDHVGRISAPLRCVSTGKVGVKGFQHMERGGLSQFVLIIPSKEKLSMRDTQPHVCCISCRTTAESQRSVSQLRKRYVSMNLLSSFRSV
jgi:hypothetical protein